VTSSAPILFHTYQEKAIRWMIGHRYAAVWLSPGLGKTAITLEVLKVLLKAGQIKRALIICPLRVAYSTWPAEAEKWANFSDLRIAVLHGPKKQEALDSGAEICVTNPDSTPWLFDTARFRASGFDCLVLDESSLYKEGRTRRFKMLKKVLPSFKRRYQLTGTPATEGLMGLWAQMYLLDGGVALTPFITHYRMKYFVPHGFQQKEWKLRDGAAQEIYAVVAPLAIQMSSEDYLALPELVLNTLRVDLPPVVMGVYKKMERDFIAQIGEGVVTAANAAVASMKLRQIVGGGVYTGSMLDVVDHRAVEELHTAKLDVLEELVEELQGAPLLVAFEFVQEMERIKKRLGPHIPNLSGGVSPAAGKEIVDRWNRGEIPVLLVHPTTTKFGLNIQGGGGNLCFYTLPWSSEAYIQLTARIWRQGSKAKRVFVHHLVARGTIDEVVLKVLGQKEKTQTALFDALKLLTTEL